MRETVFFVSFSAVQFPSLSCSFVYGNPVCVVCVRATAFTDTYFISKQDFSVCDLLPLPWYILDSVRAKIHWFQISDDYTLYYYTHSHQRHECTFMYVCVCVEKKEKTVNYHFDIIFIYLYIYTTPTDGRQRPRPRRSPTPHIMRLSFSGCVRCAYIYVQ